MQRVILLMLTLAAEVGCGAEESTAACDDVVAVAVHAEPIERGKGGVVFQPADATETCARGGESPVLDIQLRSAVTYRVWAEATRASGVRRVDDWGVVTLAGDRVLSFDVGFELNVLISQPPAVGSHAR